jgi:cytochrome b561
LFSLRDDPGGCAGREPKEPQIFGSGAMCPCGMATGALASAGSDPNWRVWSSWIGLILVASHGFMALLLHFYCHRY